MAQDNSPWQYKPDSKAADPNLSAADSADAPRPKVPDAKSVTWQATEFIEHDHPPTWYLGLALFTVALSVAAYFATKDLFTVVILVVLGIVVGIFAGHKPGMANYEINQNGLSINGKLYNFGSFKSFSIYQEGRLSSLNLLPLKKFAPTVSAYFPPADENKITQAIGNYLPMSEHKLDRVEKISRRLRF